MSRLITDADRAYILDQLKLAPDDVLVDAFLAWDGLRRKTIACRNVMLDIESDKTAVEAVVNTAWANQSKDEMQQPVPRQNVNPGKSAITRIGTETKKELLSMLHGGVQPDAKWQEHLKLLWERGEVKFDGKDWYL